MQVDIEQVDRQLQEICDRAILYESRYASELAAVHPAFQDSARNLVHYMALRHDDVRQLQENLASLGLSSLGRAERNVLPLITMVRNALARMVGNSKADTSISSVDLSLHHPGAQTHTKEIFGETGRNREVHIMVTLPIDASTNYPLVVGMIEAGMNVARINCGHDSEPTWAAMVENVRRASAETGSECKIQMDLSGVKLRTSQLRPGPRVVHVRPRRDPLGRIIGRRRLRCVTDDDLPQARKKSAVIPVPRECLEAANVGDKIRLRDTRGKKRHFTVVDKNDNSLLLEFRKGAYISSGTRLVLNRLDGGDSLNFKVGTLPTIEQPIRLHPGDTLVMHSKHLPGAPATIGADGEISEPAHIGCQQSEVFEYVRAGDPIVLNDGKIEGVVQSASKEQLEIEITHAKPTGSKLRENRGINFPKSKIPFAGLTGSDRKNLSFIVNHADAIGLSFVRTPEDIRLLQEALAQFSDKRIGLVIKIETVEGFNNLPELLLAAMRTYPAAIMIARGDLAIDCGWERLAELQEEILWLCEAARLPVIWATDVLVQEARSGRPSRAEITDAAMSQRADCVMLNKGPHIIATIRTLDNILRRMQDHQHKKTARLRKLSISH